MTNSCARPARRAIGYVRRSTNRQEQSIPDQLRWITKMADDEDLTFEVPGEIIGLISNQSKLPKRCGDLYVDDAISGARTDRPGLLAMLRRIREDDEVSHLFVWDRSRLGRFERNEVGIALENDILEVGVRIIFNDKRLEPHYISDGGGTDDILKIVEYQQAAKARIKLAEDTIRGQMNKAMQGFWCGGQPPYGFVRAVCDVATRTTEVLSNNATISKSAQKTKSKGVVVIPGVDPENVKRLAVARYIHEEYQRGVLGLDRIAQELNRRQIPSPYAGRKRINREGKDAELPGVWSINSVRGVLEQPLYAGKVAWARREYGNNRRSDKNSPTGFRKVTNAERKKTGRRSSRAHEHRDPKDWVIAEPAVPFPPIIPWSLWEANMARLAERRHQSGQPTGQPKCADGSKFPIPVYCGDCGARMAGHYHGGKPTWYCSTHINTGRTKCQPNWVSRDDIVIFAVESLRRRIKALKREKALREEVRRVVEKNRDCKTDLEAKIDLAKLKVSGLEKDYGQAFAATFEGDAEERKAAEPIAEKLKAKLQAAKAEVVHLEVRLISLGVVGDDEIGSALAFLERFGRILDNMDAGKLRQVFTAMGTKLTVNFGPNPNPQGKRARRRVPVGGVLTFGATVESLGGLPQVLGNEEPSAVAEGPSSKDETWLGCGGRI